MYIWELPDWPRFRWNTERLVPVLADAHLKQGRLLGRMERLGFALRLEAELEVATEEALKTSEIEGEILDPDAVRSSVARYLGVPNAALGPEDRRAEGVVEMTLDATKNFVAPLTRQRLFTWQAGLFPAGSSETARVGAWRDGPIQVRSGPHGRQQIHFEGPPAPRIETEMERFFAWFNEPLAIDGIVRAAIAHLWFVTVHPFEDGNGRVARALAEMCLARSENSVQRFYSLSAQIRRDRSRYYSSLETVQKGDLEISPQLLWFVECLSMAIDEAEHDCRAILQKADFWQRHANTDLNERQRKVLNRCLDGFEGKLTARKWTSITKCSKATAQRDIKELIDRTILVRNPGGSKNASYSLAELPIG